MHQGSFLGPEVQNFDVMPRGFVSEAAILCHLIWRNGFHWAPKEDTYVTMSAPDEVCELIFKSQSRNS